jgi:CRP-like cAMP-binding protein
MHIDPYELRKFVLLDALSHEELAGMVKHLTRGSFKAGASICIEGEEGDKCYFLMQGHVLVSRALGDGRFVRLAHYNEGAIFGQSGLFEGVRRTAMMAAQTDVDVLYLDRSTFQWALSRKLPWAILFLQVLSISLTRQLRASMVRFEEMVQADEAAVAEEIMGEVIEPVGQERIYLNLSDSYTALPALGSSPSMEGSAVHDDLTESEQKELSEKEQFRALLEASDIQIDKL